MRLGKNDAFGFELKRDKDGVYSVNLRTPSNGRRKRFSGSISACLEYIRTEDKEQRGILPNLQFGTYDSNRGYLTKSAQEAIVRTGQLKADPKAISSIRLDETVSKEDKESIDDYLKANGYRVHSYPRLPLPPCVEDECFELSRVDNGFIMQRAKSLGITCREVMDKMRESGSRYI